MTVDWQRLYKRFSAQICAINCGELCAPSNGGVPRCCANTKQEPVLFTSELAWLQTKTDLWDLKPIKTRRDRRSAEAIEDYIKYAYCKGLASCKRGYRSLTCRFFPLEPYFLPGKKFAGLTYLYRAESECPLIDHPKIKISQTYIDQAIVVWQELFAAFPREIEIYINVSRGLRMSMKRKGRIPQIFPASH